MTYKCIKCKHSFVKRGGVVSIHIRKNPCPLCGEELWASLYCNPMGYVNHSYEETLEMEEDKAKMATSDGESLAVGIVRTAAQQIFKDDPSIESVEIRKGEEGVIITREKVILDDEAEKPTPPPGDGMEKAVINITIYDIPVLIGGKPTKAGTIFMEMVHKAAGMGGPPPDTLTGVYIYREWRRVWACFEKFSKSRKRAYMNDLMEAEMTGHFNTSINHLFAAAQTFGALNKWLDRMMLSEENPWLKGDV